MDKDYYKANIRCSVITNQYMEELVENNLFKDQKDIFQLGIAIALKKDLSVNENTNIERKNKWDTPTVDPDKHFHNAILLKYPDKEEKLYTFMEMLGDIGVKYIYERLKSQDYLDLSALDI